MQKNKTSHRTFSTSEISYLAMAVAASVVGRLMFQFIPNVQPMTAIFLIITLQLGIFQGLIINVLSLLVTSIYMGMGVWTISQIISFSSIIILMGLFSKLTLFRRYRFFQICYSVFAGFLYGFIISYIDVKVYGMAHFFPYYFTGLSFDALHALGNGFFYFLLLPIFNRILKKQNKDRNK